jgi:hypothetical protein
MKARKGCWPSKATGKRKAAAVGSPLTFLLSTTEPPHVEKTTCATATSENSKT